MSGRYVQSIIEWARAWCNLALKWNGINHLTRVRGIFIAAVQPQGKFLHFTLFFTGARRNSLLESLLPSAFTSPRSSPLGAGTPNTINQSKNNRLHSVLVGIVCRFGSCWKTQLGYKGSSKMNYVEIDNKNHFQLLLLCNLVLDKATIIYRIEGSVSSAKHWQ